MYIEIFKMRVLLSFLVWLYFMYKHNLKKSANYLDTIQIDIDIVQDFL